jgi:5-methylcytosine-specific restriction endonuclease McrA
MAVKKKRRILTKRTRNNGTMTESMFWSMIRSTLRNKSRWWKPISQCKSNARRKYNGPNKRQRWEYQCAKCKKWWSEKNINVDHIIPAGSLQCADDLPGFVERLFVEVEGLQVLCSNCHNLKTKSERNEK